MATTPESKVKQTVDQVLTSVKAYTISPTTGGYGKSGHSDRISCVPDQRGGLGYFMVVEVKAGVKKPTSLQKKRILSALASGAFACVVNPSNVKAFTEWVWAIHTGQEDVPQLLLPDGYDLIINNEVGHV